MVPFVFPYWCPWPRINPGKSGEWVKKDIATAKWLQGKKRGKGKEGKSEASHIEVEEEVERDAERGRMSVWIRMGKTPLTRRTPRKMFWSVVHVDGGRKREEGKKWSSRTKEKNVYIARVCEKKKNTHEHARD